MTSLAARLREQASSRGRHPFVEDARSARIIRYDELGTVLDRWSALLDERGVPEGEGVVLDIDDPLALTATFLGVVAAGRCAVPVDPEAPEAELARIVRAAGPTLEVTDRAANDRAAHDRSGRTGLVTVTIDPVTGEPPPPRTSAGTSPSAGPAYATASAGTLRPAGRAQPGSAEPAGSGAVRLCTSGSTGEPKTVELDETHLLHVAAAVAAHHELGPDDRGYNPLPLFHINAEVVGVLATLLAGSTLVLDRRFHRHGFWSLMGDREITWCNAVPAILAILADEPAPPPLPSLRFVRSASAPLPPAIRQRITAMLGVDVVESYGMTEAASQITATPLNEHAPAGSAGQPVRTELCIRRRDGSAADPGEIGRIWIRGTGVIRAYLGGRAADRFDDDNWLDTGDLGSLDTHGFLTHAGRADDVINRGGEMIYPREVEEVLAEHPRVVEVAVVGQPDAILGAVPVAFVLARPDDDEVPKAELAALCDAQLSRFKRPVAFHVVSDLPRTSAGKIRRHKVALSASGGSQRS